MMVDKIMAYEAGEMAEEEIISFFQELLDSGMVWQLQGHYGRTATAMLEQGLIERKKPAQEEPVPALAKKLHPRRFPNMSPKMSAIVGYIIGEVWTSPAIGSLSITSDGFLIHGNYNILGSAEDFKRNIDNLLAVAGLTTEEEVEFRALMNRKVRDFR